MREFSFRHVVEILDFPEEYDLQEFARRCVSMETNIIYYFDGKLFSIEYYVADAVIEGCFTIVECITKVWFCKINKFNKWLLYHENDDEPEYVSKIKKIRGDTVIIPVIKSKDRFIKKINEKIEKGEYHSFIENKM